MSTNRLMIGEGLKYPYTDWIKSGWSDAQLIAAGYMAANDHTPPPLPNTAGDWPDPVNFFPGKFEAPPFDGSEVPPVIAEYPLLFAQHSGFDLSGLLGAALTTAAACITDQIQICANSATKWFTQARLWHLDIASSGAGKSPVQKAVLRPLWAIHKELYAEWQRAVEAQDDDDKEKIPQPRVIVTDTTIEKMTDVLAENPRGVYYVTDEFSTLIGSMGKYSKVDNGADRGAWLKSFEGEPMQRERVNRGSVFVPNWGISILSATTAVQMEAYAKQLPADGLIQRFLISISRAQRAVTSGIPTLALERAEANYLTTLRLLWNLQPAMHSGVVQLSPPARARFDEWRVEMQKLSTAFDVSETHPYASHLRKYPTFALRIALTYHCAQVVHMAREPHTIADPAKHPVSVETMELAFRYLDRQLYHAHALYLRGEGKSSGMGVAQAIAKFLVSRPTLASDKPLERRDLLRGCSAFNEAEEYTQATALRLVESFGWIRIIDVGAITEGKVYRKQHPTQFHVNPKIATKFAALAAEERERRSVIVEHFAELRSGH